MNENIIKSLECSYSNFINHIAKNASILSCGHLICKECLPDNDKILINCKLCGKRNDISLESLRNMNEIYPISRLIELSLSELFNKTKENFGSALDSFKGNIKLAS
jgi:transcription elongation factor Elf1